MAKELARTVDVADLTRRIINIHTEIAASVANLIKTKVAKAVEAGNMLLQLKAAHTQGKWQDWVEATFPFSMRGAQRYMQLAKYSPLVGQEPSKMADFLPEEVLKLLPTPPKKPTTTSTTARIAPPPLAPDIDDEPADEPEETPALAEPEETDANESGLTDLTETLINGTPADTPKQRAILAELPPERQEAAALLIANEDCRTVSQAIERTEPKTPAAPKDGKGFVIPESIRAAWSTAMQFDDIARSLSTTLAQVRKLCEDPKIGAYLEILSFDRDIRNLKHALKFARPYVVCRECDGAGCGPCRNTGWMPQTSMTRNAEAA